MKLEGSDKRWYLNEKESIYIEDRLDDIFDDKMKMIENIPCVMVFSFFYGSFFWSRQLGLPIKFHGIDHIKLKRNDKCLCDSGKKYKKCHLKEFNNLERRKI